MHFVTGLLLVALAGLGTGTSAWPIKKIDKLHFEQYLFVLMFTGIICYPWIAVLLKIPDLKLVIRQVGVQPLLISNLLSVSWGVANVLYLLCTVRIGAALTGAILSAVGMSTGVIMPMVFKGSGLFAKAPDIFSAAGFSILTALVVIILGVWLGTVAGFGREKILSRGTGSVDTRRASDRFLKNLILVMLAGVLSSGLSLAFVYSQGPVLEAARHQGVGETSANMLVWALGMAGGGLVNIGYAIYLMARRKSWSLMFVRKDEILYGALAGFQFIASILLMGKGMVWLGALGASVGFAIQQSMQVIGNQLVGFIGGEWKGIYGKPRNQMHVAIAIILFAVILLAYSNSLQG